ncbi:hypothetical protein G6F59_018975 [Rhizopus arrhizus]|nr:hypothetical protein G6F59_018975 [Rhizopus arrhizus]
MLPFSDTNAMTFRKPELDLATLMPCRCTSCGSSGMASCSLFCTCTWAMSGSVPVSKVRVICARPLEDEEELKYSR